MTSSTRNKGEGDKPIRQEKIEKIMVSARVPRYVVEFAKERDISLSELLMAGFDRYRENDVNHALERLSYHENRVLHWKQKVLHYDEESNTKERICNTIRGEFLKLGRGQPGNERLDKNWLSCKLIIFQRERIPISLDELYGYCIQEEKKK